MTCDVRLVTCGMKCNQNSSRISYSPLYPQITFDSTQHGWNLDEMGPPYPLFVNEAAYYEQGVALVLARKTSVEVRCHQVWFNARILFV